MQTDLIRIGTRGSALALAQAEETRARLMAAHGLPNEAFEIVVISTSGDRIQDRPLSEAGGKGLFTKEIEEALLSGAIDLAVHSSKDMPTVLPEGLELSCFLEREDVRDAYIGRAAQRLQDLPQNAVVGSSSLRRQALIRRLRPDIDVVLYRGNVQTRLRKLSEGVVDGTLLANAGLKRLGLDDVITELLSVESFPPAPGQGAICIESRIGDARVIELVAAIGDAETTTALAAERAFLARLDGSCRTPIAAYAQHERGILHFHGMILTPDGSRMHEIRASGSPDDARRVGEDCGARLLEQAGSGFFDGWVETSGWRAS